MQIISHQRLPPHWPKHISYLFAPAYASSLPPHVLTQIRTGHPVPPSSCGRSVAVVIRLIAAQDHPAVGQHGLFAARIIPPHTHICDYLGEVHCEDRQSDYDLSLLRTQDGIHVGIDASQMGNEGRFVNDYRGVQARPNAVFKDARTATGELRMAIWSGSSKIRKGEEILVSYGKSWWKARHADIGYPTR